MTGRYCLQRLNACPCGSEPLLLPWPGGERCAIGVLIAFLCVYKDYGCYILGEEEDGGIDVGCDEEAIGLSRFGREKKKGVGARDVVVNISNTEKVSLYGVFPTLDICKQSITVFVMLVCSRKPNAAHN